MSHDRDAVRPVVPLRGLGRSTEHTDEWTRVRFQAILRSAKLIPDTSEILAREAPDGVLELNGRSIGIEYTEAVPTTYARADAYRNRHHPDARLDRELFQPGGVGERADPSDLLRDPVAPDRSPGWSGDSVERELANLVLHAISTKTDKLNSHFDRFDEDWLVVYASTPGPLPDLDRVLDLVGLSPTAESDREFDRIYLLRDREALCLRSRATYMAPTT